MCPNGEKFWNFKVPYTILFIMVVTRRRNSFNKFRIEALTRPRPSSPQHRRRSEITVEERRETPMADITWMLDAIDEDPKREMTEPSQVANNPFFNAMFDVLCAHKNEMSLQLDEGTDTNGESSHVDSLIEKAFSVLDTDDCEDEDPNDEGTAIHYKIKIEELKNAYEEQRGLLVQDMENTVKSMDSVLERQSKLRPISLQDRQKAVDSVYRKFRDADYKMREETCRQALVYNKHLDARRKRRNFSKEAREILQQYYDDHNNHPYPSDEDKQALADKCRITVQQVSNWFGNRRIRQKKAQQTQNLANMQIFAHNTMMTDIRPAMDSAVLQVIPSCSYPMDTTMHPIPSFQMAQHQYQMDVGNAQFPLQSVYGNNVTYLP